MSTLALYIHTHICVYMYVCAPDNARLVYYCSSLVVFCQLVVLKHLSLLHILCVVKPLCTFLEFLDVRSSGLVSCLETPVTHTHTDTRRKEGGKAHPTPCTRVCSFLVWRTSLLQAQGPALHISSV